MISVDGNYLILALMKKEANDVAKIFGKHTSDEIEKNDVLKQNLESYFHVSEITELKEDLVIEDIPNVGTLEKDTTTHKKTGVLMVMMENYNNKSEKFLPSGSIAVALKDTPESKEIIDNIHNIGYILFHIRKDEGKHLFIVEKNSIVDIDGIEKGIYKTTNKGTKYALVSFNHEFELLSDSLHPQKKKNKNKSTRYDAQYAILNELK